jgi:hypothetical protein
MSKEIKLIVGNTLILAAIASIGNRSKKLDSDVQLAGLSILKHVDEHGDTTLADKLMNALPKGARRLALAEWFVSHGKLRMLDRTVPAEAAAIKEGRIFQHEKRRTTNMADAMATPWYEMRKEPEHTTIFDAQAAVTNLMARITGAVGKGLSIQHKQEALAQLDELRTALEKA